MRIIETYSHLNGLEFLLVHKSKLWKELQQVIAAIDANACKTKISKEKTMKGKVLYSPIVMNQQFKKLLAARNWGESRVSYWVTKDENNGIACFGTKGGNRSCRGSCHFQL